jgi:uncharacterized protein YwqG
MALSERDELEETALPAVLVRRSDLPVPLTHTARSFFGGLPGLPPQLEWPTAEVSANKTSETVALTFVAQIDLAEVPGSGWSPLPKRGTLYSSAARSSWAKGVRLAAFSTVPPGVMRIPTARHPQT